LAAALAVHHAALAWAAIAAEPVALHPPAAVAVQPAAMPALAAAAQSAAASLSITAQLQNTSQLHDTVSRFRQLNSDSILSELQASFSLLNATVSKDLNAVLQRCEESVLMIDSNNMQANSNTEIDNRIDSLVSLVKDTRTELSNHASELESVRGIAVNSSKFIAEYELHALKSRSELNELKIVVTSISTKVEEKEMKDDSVLNNLKTSIEDFSFKIGENKQHDEKNDAALLDLMSSVTALSKKIEESGRDNDERINLVRDDLNMSIASLSKKIDEVTNEEEKKNFALNEIKMSIAALSLKIDEGKDKNNTQSSLCEEVKSSISSLRTDVTVLNASFVSLPNKIPSLSNKKRYQILQFN
jgi:chromosome segregation ATPase